MVVAAPRTPDDARVPYLLASLWGASWLALAWRARGVPTNGPARHRHRILALLAVATVVPVLPALLVPCTFARGLVERRPWDGGDPVLAAPHGFGVEFAMVLLGWWLVMVQAAWFVRPSLRLRLGHVVPTDDPALLARTAELASRLRLAPPRVAQRRGDLGLQVAAWAIDGLLPTVVVDDGVLLRLPAAEQDALLAHELGHLARRHGWRCVVTAVAVAVASVLASGVGGLWVALPWLLACRACSVVLLGQREEFAADRLGAQLVGRATMARVLDRTHAANHQHATHPFVHAMLSHPHRDERLARLGVDAGPNARRAKWARWTGLSLAGSALLASLWLGACGHVVPGSVLAIAIALVPAVLPRLLLPSASRRDLRRLGFGLLQRTTRWRMALIGSGMLLTAIAASIPREAGEVLLLPTVALVLTGLLLGRTAQRARQRLNRHAAALDWPAWQREYERLPARVQREPDLWCLRCEIAWLAGQPEQARRELDRLLARWPQFHFARLYAIAWLRNTDPAAAARQARDLVAMLPGHPTAIAGLAGALRRTGELDEAWALAREAIRLAPHDGTHHALLARIALARGDLPAARCALGDAQRLAVGAFHVALAEVDLAVAERRPDAEALLAALRARLAREPFLHLDADLDRLAAALAAAAPPGNDDPRAAPTS